MTIKRILLVVPPLVSREDNSGFRPDFEAYRLVSPVEPTQVASILREDGFTPKIFDLGVFETGGDQKLEFEIKSFQPDCVCVIQSILTFATAEDFDGKWVFDLVKTIDPKIISVLTGCHATNYPGKAVGEDICAYSIRGEVDYAISGLLKNLNDEKELIDMPGISFKTDQGEVINSNAYPSVDIEALPLPAYDLFNENELEQYYKFPEYAKIRFPEKSVKYRDIMSSRSCILRCSFCSVAFLRGEKQRYRRKKTDQVIAEIEQALSQGVEEIHFFDDLFVRSEEQILEFCNELSKRNLKFPWFVAQGQPLWPLTYDALHAMKETGMYRVIAPFESGNDRVLKRVVGKLSSVEGNKQVIKWLSELDIEIIGMFVIGMPGETAEDILETITFAEQHPEIDYNVFSIATPMVGTRMMKQITKQGMLDDQDSINRIIKRTVALFKTEEFSQLSMGIIRCFDWDRINFSTEERKIKYAKMVGITMEELDVVREFSRKTFERYYPDYDGPTSYREILNYREGEFDKRLPEPIIPESLY